VIPPAIFRAMTVIDTSERINDESSSGVPRSTLNRNTATRKQV